MKAFRANTAHGELFLLAHSVFPFETDDWILSVASIKVRLKAHLFEVFGRCLSGLLCHPAGLEALVVGVSKVVAVSIAHVTTLVDAIAVVLHLQVTKGVVLVFFAFKRAPIFVVHWVGLSVATEGAAFLNPGTSSSWTRIHLVKVLLTLAFNKQVCVVVCLNVLSCQVIRVSDCISFAPLMFVQAPRTPRKSRPSRTVLITICKTDQSPKDRCSRNTGRIAQR